MRHIIACEVFRHELEYLAGKMSQAPHLHFLKQGLHDTPNQLTVEVQGAIDELEMQGAGEIQLCYGLCGRGISGVRSRSADLIIPAVHDCIPLLMGRGPSEQKRDKSIYWMSAGWLEYSQLPFLREKTKRRQDYVERFGEDSADYLMEMEDSWLSDYTSASLILWDGVGDAARLRIQAHHVAEQANLPYTEFEGSPSVLEAIVSMNFEKSPVPLFRIHPGEHMDIDGSGQLVIMGG